MGMGASSGAAAPACLRLPRATAAGGLAGGAGESGGAVAVAGSGPRGQVQQPQGWVLEVPGAGKWLLAELCANLKIGDEAPVAPTGPSTRASSVTTCSLLSGVTVSGIVNWVSWRKIGGFKVEKIDAYASVVSDCRILKLKFQHGARHRGSPTGGSRCSKSRGSPASRRVPASRWGRLRRSSLMGRPGRLRRESGPSPLSSLLGTGRRTSIV